MSVRPRIAAILLAAGRGVRFGEGSQKLLADLHGRPLVRYVAETALRSRVGQTIVVTGHAGEQIEAALAGLPLSFVRNSDFAHGLSTSLRRGLAAAGEADAVVFLLGDTPGVSSGTIDALVSAFEREPDSPAVVPLRHGARGAPALLARRMFPQLMALSGDEGARRLLANTDGVVEVSIDHDESFVDVDTPQDLARLRRLFNRS